jgi:hypothetical protein
MAWAPVVDVVHRPLQQLEGDELLDAVQSHLHQRRLAGVHGIAQEAQQLCTNNNTAGSTSSGKQRVGAVHARQAVPAASSSCYKGSKCFCARCQAQILIHLWLRCRAAHPGVAAAPRSAAAPQAVWQSQRRATPAYGQGPPHAPLLPLQLLLPLPRLFCWG